VAARSESTPWRGDPLPRGRHKLSVDEVRASQRERLLRAMLELVGERGYAATTVPDVVAAARVSRNGFYALFEDKADCFLALCDEVANEILDELFALGDQESWRAALERGMEIYLRSWQDRPLFARAYLVELPSAGERAIEQRDRQFERFRALFDGMAAWARRDDPSLPELNPLATRLLVGGITELVAEEVRAGRVDALVERRDELVELVARVIA
jgi:AcrR family transcriptional regulator